MMKPYSESIRFYFDTIFLFYRLVLDREQQAQQQSCLFHLQTAQMSCVDCFHKTLRIHKNIVANKYSKTGMKAQ